MVVEPQRPFKRLSSQNKEWREEISADNPKLSTRDMDYCPTWNSEEINKIWRKFLRVGHEEQASVRGSASRCIVDIARARRQTLILVIWWRVLSKWWTPPSCLVTHEEPCPSKDRLTFLLLLDVKLWMQPGMLKLRSSQTDQENELILQWHDH